MRIGKHLSLEGVQSSEGEEEEKENAHGRKNLIELSQSGRKGM